MNSYNVIYPVYGAVNRNLHLEETKVWMECGSFGQVMDLRGPAEPIAAVFKAKGTDSILSE